MGLDCALFFIIGMMDVEGLRPVLFYRELI